MPSSKAARAAFNETLTAKATEMTKAFESRDDAKEKNKKGKGKGKAAKETQSALIT